MDGDGARRYCQQCDLHVVDTSELDDRQLAPLIRRSKTDRVCVRRRSSDAESTVARHGTRGWPAAALVWGLMTAACAAHDPPGDSLTVDPPPTSDPLSYAPIEDSRLAPVPGVEPGAVEGVGCSVTETRYHVMGAPGYPATGVRVVRQRDEPNIGVVKMRRPRQYVDREPTPTSRRAQRKAKRRTRVLARRARANARRASRRKALAKAPKLSDWRRRSQARAAVRAQRRVDRRRRMAQRRAERTARIAARRTNRRARMAMRRRHRAT